MEDLLKLQIQDFKGVHNSDLTKSSERLEKARSSKDLSTICIIPNDGLIASRVAENWLGQVSQMNQKFLRLMVIGFEKYHAFNTTIEQIVNTPGLNEFKYILTLEEDILPPFDGLMRLFENIEKYDVVGALTWTKGEDGHPMIYGRPDMFPQAYIPMSPEPDKIQECLAVGTGFTLFKLDLFKNPMLPRPWFRTNPPIIPGKKKTGDPDMYFFENIHKLGYKVACDTRVRVGTLDKESNLVW